MVSGIDNLDLNGSRSFSGSNRLLVTMSLSSSSSKFPTKKFDPVFLHIENQMLYIFDASQNFCYFADYQNYEENLTPYFYDGASFSVLGMPT